MNAIKLIKDNIFSKGANGICVSYGRRLDIEVDVLKLAKIQDFHIEDHFLSFESDCKEITFSKEDDMNVFVKVSDKINAEERNFLICINIYRERKNLSFLLLDFGSQSVIKDMNLLDKNLPQVSDMNTLFDVANRLKSVNVMTLAPVFFQ